MSAWTLSGLFLGLPLRFGAFTLYRFHQRDDLPRLVLVPSPDHYRDRERGGGHRDVDLRPFLPVVTVIADELPPFLAATVELSIESSSISTIPFPYPSSTRASMIRFHTPSLSHLLSLLFAVESSPYLLGTSTHLHPVTRTNRMPLTIDRSSALGLPSLAPGGRRGSILLHLASSSSSNFIYNENGRDASQCRRQFHETRWSSIEIASSRHRLKFTPCAFLTRRNMPEFKSNIVVGILIAIIAASAIGAALILARFG